MFKRSTILVIVLLHCSVSSGVSVKQNAIDFPDEEPFNDIEFNDEVVEGEDSPDDPSEKHNDEVEGLEDMINDGDTDDYIDTEWNFDESNKEEAKVVNDEDEMDEVGIKDGEEEVVPVERPIQDEKNDFDGDGELPAQMQVKGPVVANAQRFRGRTRTNVKHTISTESRTKNMVEFMNDDDEGNASFSIREPGFVDLSHTRQNQASVVLVFAVILAVYWWRSNSKFDAFALPSVMRKKYNKRRRSAVRDL
eukprot:CFRG4034T1